MKYHKHFSVGKNPQFRLTDIDPGSHEPALDEASAILALTQNREILAERQFRLYAEKRHSVLIVLQAMDAGGKDGTINHVLSAFNPQGTSVTSFKQPTPVELAHDFLWRVHKHAPAKGEIAVFNRSHYEDVLITRVHGLIDQDQCRQRYQAICDFEDSLVQNGTLILKIFLHISQQEQLQRFATRLKDARRNWKISESDYAERAYWDDYQQAFQDAIRATSTNAAPWYVVPANHKWFRNLAVSQILVERLDGLAMQYPAPRVDLNVIRQKYHEAVQQQHAARSGQA